MPRFSQKSINRLNTCHPELRRLFENVVETFDCSIVYGFRGNDEQDKLFDEGKSKLKGGQSKHNRFPSLAVDVAPYPIDWDDTKRFYYFAGYVKRTAEDMKIKIRWGGDWDGDNNLNDQSFMDLVHFELII